MPADMPDVTPTVRECDRCDRLAELAPIGIASINGHTIDPCTVCTECEEVYRRNHKQFWNEGWKRYPLGAADAQ